MRFIKKWSYSAAKRLQRRMKVPHEKRAVYYYGFQIIIGSIVKAVLVILISSLLGCLIPTLIVVGVFGSLRMLAGGVHMDSYGECITTGIILMIGSAVLAQYTYLKWSTLALVVLFAVSILFGIFVIYRYAPADTPNKPITDQEEIKRLRKLSLKYLLIWSILIVPMIYFDMKLYVLAMCGGLILELFTVTPVGYLFFGLVSKIVSRKLLM